MHPVDTHVASLYDNNIFFRDGKLYKRNLNYFLCSIFISSPFHLF